ncbi:MAG: hypothetical protein GXP38_05930, partial [Chloroflexi bacterium]|nr:hypothetical protein [Chloroflexota bacterium]
LLVKIITTPRIYTNTPQPPAACPPRDPNDWRYLQRYRKYGVDVAKEEAYKALIRDFIRYFSAQDDTVINPELFGDELAHPTLGMPGVLYEVWNEPNYEIEWCDSETNFWRLYQLITEAAAEVRGPDLLSFSIGGPGWRHETLRNDDLPPAFGAPDCLAADDLACGAVRRFYDFLQSENYLENGHISWWSYSYLPTELTTGSTRIHLDNIRHILQDARYEGHYDDTQVIVGEWATPFADKPQDLLPSAAWAEEYGTLFGKNINDDNEVGASLVPARLWDMTQTSPPPAFQAYFAVAEWPQNDSLPLFKGVSGVMTAQVTGLLKAISNVFLLLNRLQPRELSTVYQANPMLQLVATASEDGRELAVLSWYHPSIKRYETKGVVTYDALMTGLAEDGIAPLTVTLNFQHLEPSTAYTQTLFVVDSSHSNAFTYRHAVLADLQAHCGNNPQQWQRTCVYQRISDINTWTLDGPGPGASVGLESTTSVLTSDAQGQGQISFTLEPYSVWLLTLAP